MIYINIYIIYIYIYIYIYTLIANGILSFHSLQLPSVMKHNLNTVTLFRKKARARIAQTFIIKVKLQSVVVKLAVLLEYF